MQASASLVKAETLATDGLRVSGMAGIRLLHHAAEQMRFLGSTRSLVVRSERQVVARQGFAHVLLM